MNIRTEIIYMILKEIFIKVGRRKSMSKMNNFIEKVQLLTSGIQQNRYMQVISDGLMTLLPVLVIGAFSTLFSSIAWQPYQNIIAPIKDILGAPATMTTNIIALYAVVSISYKLATSFDEDGFIPALIGLASFLVLTPLSIFKVNNVESKTLDMNWLGAKGLFVAIIVGILTTRIYVFIVKKNWTIKMPEGVSPAVAKTFSGLIPAIITIIVSMIISMIFSLTSYKTIHQFVYTMFQIPLQHLGGSIWALLIAVLVMQLLWTLGIHGAIVVLAIVKPIWMSLDLENLNAYQKGLELPNIVGMGFWAVFSNFAPMLGLAMVLTLFVKSYKLKTIGKLGLPGAFFGIHEPFIFGLPIVLNPILAVPYIIAPVVCDIIGYFLTLWGLLPKAIGVYPPFGTPVFFMGLVEGSWKLGVIQLLLIPLCAAIYYPFVKAIDNKNLAEEKNLSSKLANAE